MRPALSRTLFITLIFATCTAYLPQLAHAHGAGLTFTATTTDAIIDVDYGSFTVAAEETGRFDFRLFKDAERTKPVDFERVWVRIVHGDTRTGDTIFSGSIAKALFGPSGISITLPESGLYNMTVRYTMGDTELAEAVIPFTVEPPYKSPFIFGREFFTGTAAGALVITLLAIALWFVIRRRS